MRVGDLVDARYRVDAVLGEGGVGRVFRARQLKLDRDVAVKVLLDPDLSDAAKRPRFEREALAMAALGHPNVVAVQDYGVFEERPFLVMELLEGQSLRARLDAGPLPADEAVRVATDLLRGLAYTHEQGVVHRDLKPGNVFLQAFPTQPDHVKILDFGFAKFMDESRLSGGPALTVVGTTMGTPAYVSPERLYGGVVDGRADLYSVGILLFEMLSGEKPYAGSTSEILRAHLGTPVPRLADRAPGLDEVEALTDFFERALAKHLDDRFRTAGEMLSALQALPSPCASWEAGADPAGAPADQPTFLILTTPGRPPLRERVVHVRRQVSMRTRRRMRSLRRKTQQYLHRALRWAAPRVRRLDRGVRAQLGRVAEHLRARLRRGPPRPVLALPAHASGSARESPVATERCGAEQTFFERPPELSPERLEDPRRPRPAQES